MIFENRRTPIRRKILLLYNNNNILYKFSYEIDKAELYNNYRHKITCRMPFYAPVPFSLRLFYAADILGLEQTRKKNESETESLTRRVAKNGFWAFALRFMNRGLGFIRTIILARLLAPSDFGLLGLAMLAITTLDTFSQTGFQAALIQKKQGTASFLNTAWTVSGFRAILLFVILFTTAPAISKFFGSPDAIWVIRIIALSTLLTGFRNIGLLYFQKELQFNKVFFYESFSTLIDLCLAIPLALILRNVWALVWAGLAGQFARLILSYVVHSYRPRLRFDKSEFTELFGFGKWVFASSIMIFIATQGDDVIVGKILGIAALGFYQMAYTFSNLPATEIAQVISRVTLPAYSKLQDDVPRLRQAYLRVLQFTVFISMPLAGGIFTLAPEFTMLFLGEKWMPAVPAMQILALAGLLRSIISTMSSVFVAIKLPDVNTKCQTVRMVVLALVIYPLTAKWGILGASYSALFSLIVSTIIFSMNLKKIIRISFQKFIQVIIIPTAITFIISLLFLILKAHLELITIGNFILYILIGIATYLSMVYLSDRYFNYGIQKLIRGF